MVRQAASNPDQATPPDHELRVAAEEAKRDDRMNRAQPRDDSLVLIA